MLDPFGTGYIDANHVTSLLLAIEPPMGVKGLDGQGLRIQEIVQNVMIPLRWVREVRGRGVQVMMVCISSVS